MHEKRNSHPVVSCGENNTLNFQRFITEKTVENINILIMLHEIRSLFSGIKSEALYVFSRKGLLSSRENAL